MKGRTKASAALVALPALALGAVAIPAVASDGGAAAECAIERLELPDGVTEAKLSAGDPTGSYFVGGIPDSDDTLVWNGGEVSTLSDVPVGLQDVNSSGDMTGFSYRDTDWTFHAWRYVDGESSVLPRPDGVQNTFARAIDSEGNIVGYGRDPEGFFEYTPLYWPADDPGAVHVLQGDDAVEHGLRAVDISDDGRVIGWGEYDNGVYRRGYVWPDIDSAPRPLLDPQGRHRSLAEHVSGPWVTGNDGTQNDPQGLLWNVDTGETIVATKTLNRVNSDGDATFKNPWPGVILHADGTRVTLPGLAEGRPRYIRVLLERGHDITAAGYAKDDQPGWQPVVWRGC